jgi:hypothetical protein
MDDRSISANDLQAQQNRFTSKFKIDEQPYTKAAVRIKWSALKDIMEPLEGSDPHNGLGTKWYVGWDGSTLRIALATLELTPGANAGEYNVAEKDRYELIEQNGQWNLKLITDWSTRWRGSKTALVDRYYEATTVDRIDQGFGPLDPHKDPCASIISWSWSLDDLYRQNLGSGDDPDLMELKISHGATWAEGGDGGLKGFRHVLSCNMCYDGVDRLDQSKEDPNRPYFYRGANYMQPCPALCTKYFIR